MNTIAWLKRLIAFDTTSCFSNMALIADVQTWLEQHGISSQLTKDPHENKANLFATIPAASGCTTGGLILSGHTDVVPVDGQDWASNPFDALERDGRIIGRGACDMKGFLAVVLSLVPEFCSLSLKKPIHLALSYDEEIGCRGAPLMIDAIQQAGIQAEGCIVGEPTNMLPVIAHKGIQVFRCRLHGLAAHSSLTPQGCNAIDYAAELICYLRTLADSLRKNGPFDDAFDVPFTSLSTNMINGGIASNTIPSECELIFEFRNLPDVAPASITDQIETYINTHLQPKMRQEYREAAIVLDRLASAPAFQSGSDNPMVSLTQKLLKDEHRRKVAYATEGGLFQQTGIPTVICGPGSIEQAHRANEFVSLDQLQICERFLRDIVTATGR
ncbi:acetylornithine deacetylase [Legionella sp. CNM-4043-24]|uniref:acetylornithine deacetylase n=1 Tax=Legionella sp. CNM-4043-24 TaxID=3421646 RepID=UPI00403B11B0